MSSPFHDDNIVRFPRPQVDFDEYAAGPRPLPDLEDYSFDFVEALALLGFALVVVFSFVAICWLLYALLG